MTVIYGRLELAKMKLIKHTTIGNKMESKTKFIEECMFGNQTPNGTAQENYDGHIANYGIESLEEHGITLEDVQDYMDCVRTEAYLSKN